MKNIQTSLLLLLASTNSYASDEMFTCKMSLNEIQLLFSTDSNNATVVFSESHAKGQVKITDHLYYFIFPKTKERYETRATINRYSGNITWETGNPPFGRLSMDNIHNTGICKKSVVKKSL